MKTVTDEEACTKLSSLIEEVSQQQSKCCITSSKGNAILLSEETYKNIMITLEMLSAPLFLDNS